jgi:hypothetical protein
MAYNIANFKKILYEITMGFCALKRLYWVIAAIMLASPSYALLGDDNSLVEGAKLCTQYLPRHERQYGIPVHLLAAIASTESGRYHRALGLNLPWPWTINVEGKGYFFDSKQEAIAAVQKFQSRGIQSIDVGCMQVNLHHHPNAFSSLSEAFDPAYNIAYAAQFLKNNFQEEGSWRKATADYHSHTPVYGEQYAQMVFGAWSRIINKVADARAGRLVLNAKASATPSQNHPQIVAANATTSTASSLHRRRITYHAPHMHEISVSHDTTRENGVLVIRPSHEAPAAEQHAALEEEFVTHKSSAPSAAQVIKVPTASKTALGKGQFQPDPRIIPVSTAAVDAGIKAKSSFVFDN